MEGSVPQPKWRLPGRGANEIFEIWQTVTNGLIELVRNGSTSMHPTGPIDALGTGGLNQGP